MAMTAPIAPPTKYATSPKISRNIPPVVAFLPPAFVIRAAPKIRNPRMPRTPALTMPVRPLMGFSKISGM